MGHLFISGVIIFVITLLFGVYFSYTDIRRRKIPNRPLVAFLAFGLVLNLLAVLGDRSVIPDLLPAVALTAALGLASYYLNLWPAGDGKLFIATTVCIIPLAFRPSSIAILHFCLSFVICYCLMFPYLLVYAFTMKGDKWKRWRFIIYRAGRATFSLERLSQAIMAYAASLMIPLGINLTARTIILYLVLHFIQDRLKRYVIPGIKVWHLYGIISIILLGIIRITGVVFPMVNLLYFLGFICFFNLYLSLEFVANLSWQSVDYLETGMKLDLPVYRSAGTIFSSFSPPKGAEIIFKEGIELTETQISAIKDEAKNLPKFYVIVYRPGRPLPFAPFITASALFILLKLLLQR